jgi:hypothetical protein
MSDDAPAAPSGDRDGQGRFLPGRNLGTMHALRAAGDRLPPELQHLQAELEEFMTSAVSDEGGDAEISTRRRALLTYRARLHRRIGQLDGALELHGLIDRRGRLRVAWLQQLAQLIGAARALDGLLGLSRHPKRVPASFSDAITQEPAR